MSSELLVFYLLAAAAVASAVAMVASKNTVHAVLFMAGNFLVTAVLYLLLHAPFLALVQVIVYAGAIMVLFLFVVMLMGPDALPTGETISWQRAAGLLVLAGFGAALVLAVMRSSETPGPLVADLTTARGEMGPDSFAYPAPAPDPAFGSPAAVGELLVTDYALPLEVVSILLLVAMLGAVVLGQERTG